MSFIDGPDLGAAANIIQRRHWNWLIEAVSSTPPPPVLSTTFLAARTNGGGKYSLDGIAWTNFAFPGAANISGVAQNADGFIAFPFSGTQTYISDDGITWAVGGTMPQSANWFGAVWNGSQWLAFGDFAGASRMATSPDGVNWTSSTALSQTGSVIWDGAQYVALIGNAPYLYTSADGAAWAPVATNIDGFTSAISPGNIHYFDGVYYMSGSGFDDVSFNFFWMLESVNLTSWSNAMNDGGAGEPETSGRFADNGTDTVICTSLSNDRVYARVAGVWSKVNLVNTPLFFTGGDLAFKQNIFALVSNYGTTYSSADGLTWADAAAIGSTFNWVCVT